MGDEIKVNDGKGVYDNIGLIDTLIVDCNLLEKELISGKYIGFCVKLVEMVQKLDNLKKGVLNDAEAKNKQIADLRQLIEGRGDTDV